MTTTLDPDELDDLYERPAQPSAGNADRFGGRWRLVGAGLFQVWRYGLLSLPSPSGRLLLRGPNGTGKTTALEALWPYLLDLNARQLSAGKARTTNLSSLMREGADGKRRVGFAWLSFASPDEQDVRSYGVRLGYSPNTSPQVKVLPFTVPGVPFDTFAIPTTTTLPPDEFTALVEAAGGRVFASDDAYVNDLARQVWGVEGFAVRDLVKQIREVRNPSLLGEVSPQGAADALRQSLPGVGDEIVKATADALEESEETRRAFDRDREAAEQLAAFAADWAAYVSDTVRGRHRKALEARELLTAARAAVAAKEREMTRVQREEAAARQAVAHVEEEIGKLTATLTTLRESQAYKDAGRLRELRHNRVGVAERLAGSQRRLETLARNLRDGGEDLRGAVEGVQQEFVGAVSPAVEFLGGAPARALASTGGAPRAVLRIGDESYDPGPDVTARVDHELLEETRARCEQAAADHRTRGERARLATADHEATVVPREKDLAREKEQKVRAEGELDRARKRRDSTAAEARAERDAVLDRFEMWSEPADVAALLADAADTERDDLIAELAGTDEPSGVLAALDGLAEAVNATTSARAADLRSDARALDTQAESRRADAEELRGRAADLRAGGLLPFPRPEWAGEGDDERAFGAALDWREDAPADQRDRVEAALASMGALSAEMVGDGARTGRWTVTATGPEVGRSLAKLLTVDPSHPGAATAAAVLARIPLVDRVDDEPGTALAVGLDGTWRAGVLGADPLAGTTAAPSQFVGARQRRARALLEAESLDARADELDAEADGLAGEATDLRGKAAAVEAVRSRFPALSHLRNLESKRALAAEAAHSAQQQLEAATAAEMDAQAALDSAQAVWASRTRGQDLPADVEQLRGIERMARTAVAALTDVARSLAGRVSSSVRRLERQAATLATTADDLPDAVQALRTAHSELAALEASIETLERTADSDAAAVVAEVDEAEQALRRFELSRPDLNESVTTTSTTVARVDEQLRAAQTTESEAAPAADAAVAELRTLLDGPGVAQALVLEPFEDLDAADLLTMVGERLGGRTLTRNSIVTRFDTVRGALSGVWSLDFGEEHLDLMTFVATHEDVRYSPPAAAVRAEDLRVKAEKALTSAESKALNEFVIGRLPTEIGAAWTKVLDWVEVVNRKMRDASASSGVGVQVKAVVRDDLDSAERTVYLLAARVSDAVRTVEQREEVGRALRRLIDAAPGETMAERIAAAVNIRDWLDVTYQVQRPGKAPERWSSRTGLSGGERRLVVLAPMLAALAATFDNFDSRGLRLAALDEVPAEVDEMGREGLARFIASLDLDLICTSYLWDGAPGAWDGVDAHDLEAASDGMVVAFPMLVRGEDDLPGDGVYG